MKSKSNTLARILQSPSIGSGTIRNRDLPKAFEILFGLWCIALTATTPVRAGSVAGYQVAPASTGPGQSETVQPAGTRYGLFNWLDHRSAYGEGVFPEPFLVDDSDREANELRFDWFHTKGNNQHSDLVRAELEKGFGLLTLELEVPYQRDVSAGTVSEGVGNINLGARYPIYQFVTGDGLVDSTFGTAFEVGIPVNSSVSRNSELVPKIFNDLRVGDHFTLQSVLGYSTLLGGGADGGLETFEYGFVFGYTIQREQLALPGVLQVIPILELSGETGLNEASRGHNRLRGDFGFRVNLKTIGRVQPRIGVGLIFPIDRGGRDDTHWGAITSLVFEY
jgi:hypothetical protein